MATSLQVAGLASNFDWKGFVDNIIELERTPAARLEAEKTKNSQAVNLLSTLNTRLGSLQTAAQTLKSTNLFGQRSATLTTSGSTWSASAATDATIGSYKFNVSQLATTASVTGAANIGRGLNPDGSDVSGLTIANLPIAQAVTAGTFSVNGKQVTVALTDSLQDVFAAISAATNGDVTASYSAATDRVTLTSATTNVMLGAGNDTSNFLRAFKLGNNGTATVSSSGSLGTVKTSAVLTSANLTSAVSAVDSNGAGSFSINGVAISYNINTDTLSGVLKRIGDSAAGVTATYDSLNDRLVLQNKGTGDLGISVSESAGGLLGALGLTSGTTFNRGKNALFSLNDGDVLWSASNTLDSSVHGVSGLSVTANLEGTQSVTVAADTTAMRRSINTFIDTFNSVQQFLETNTRVTTDSKGKVTAGPLAAYREVQGWGREMRTMAFDAISGLTGSVTRLNDLGIDFKTGTNELFVKDDSKLSGALSGATSSVSALFTTATTGLAAKFDKFIDKISAQNSNQQKRINQSNTGIDDQVAAIDRRLEQRRSLLEAAFIQMENAQSKIKQQQSAVDGMFASLQKSK